MTSTKPDPAEFGTEMDRDLKEWGRLMECEAVPDRLRDLAMRLREALIAAQSRECPPTGH